MLPASSKTDPVLAKVETINDDGSTSGISAFCYPLMEQVDALRRLGPCGKLLMEQAPGRACGLWREASHWSRFAGRISAPVGDLHWSSLFLKDCTLWKGSTLEKVMKNSIPWEGLILEKFVEICLL